MTTQSPGASHNEHTDRMFGRILVAFDGSAGALRAVRAALVLASDQGATVTSLTVLHHLPRYGATVGEVDEEIQVDQQHIRRLNDEVAAEAARHGMQVHCDVRLGHPAQEIVNAAQQLEADLIVIGHSGHPALLDRLLGSIAEKVSRHATCSVMIVR